MYKNGESAAHPFCDITRRKKRGLLMSPATRGLIRSVGGCWGLVLCARDTFSLLNLIHNYIRTTPKYIIININKSPLYLGTASNGSFSHIIWIIKPQLNTGSVTRWVSILYLKFIEFFDKKKVDPKGLLWRHLWCQSFKMRYGII